ncbi:hypothetical protein E0E54_03940 [Azotobacter chroococcum]|uniref:DUF5801 repeats-in-toxin domain-containing protein n=1 Tax=Azotobacter chroococcum TaxID=353 RepID=UPI00103D3A9E|nr:DUF5801 repeats-in-toxin domain-containing protein [Azotobacter chroococcum]TBW38896.1 hypothetical protein E0E54_03940 [Azotobacter chroococcum]
MGTIFDETLTEDVTIDESEGLQTSGVATTTEDNNDDDILLSSIATLLGTLDTLGAPAAGDAIEAAQNRVLTFEANVDPNLKFTLKNGDTVVTEVLSALSTTAGGDPITLVWINATTIFGYADRGGANERVAFALVLEKIEPTVGDPGGARVTIVQYEAIEHPDNTSFDEAVDLTGLVFVDAVQDIAFDDFSTAAAGQNDWNLVTDPETGIQLLFTGFERGTDTVNTSDFGIGSNAQSIGDTDGIIVDFVKGQTTPTQTSADDLANIDFNERVEGPSAGFTLVQVGGGPTNRVDARVVAYDSDELGELPPPDGTPTGDYTDGSIDGTPKTITSIKVWLVSDDPNVAEVLVRTWLRDGEVTSGDDSGVSFAIDGDGVKITGLLDNYRVEFAVDGMLDRFSVQNVSGSGGNKTFDLGDIRLGGQVGDQAEVGSHINFEDDGPSQTVTAGTTTVSVELDETTGASDRYAAGETADTYLNDDNGYLAQVTTSVAGGLAALFTVSGDYGSDLAGTLTPLLSFVGVPPEGLATSLSATHGGAITLFADSATQLSGKDTDGDTVFTIAIVDVGGVLQLQTTLIEALDNGNDTLFDEAVALLLPEGALELQYQVTRSDAEGDTVVASDTILLADDENSVFGFDDDGPTQTVSAVANAAAQLEVELDETTGASDRYAAGETADTYVNDDNGYLAQVTTTVAGGLVSLFSAAGDYGSDGAGTLTPLLSFVGVPPEGLATSLSATHGGAITLFADSATQLSGKDTDGDTVFTIAIVDVGGVLQLQTTLIEALDNGNDTLFDEAVALLLPEGALELQYQVTRSDAEGDTVVASDTILLADDATSVFSFDDDGPLPLSPVAGSIVNAAGESETFALDDGSPASFAANFGSDGKGSLVFTGMNNQILANGALLRDTASNALTSNNVAITLSGFGTHVLTASAGATTVFTMTMDSTSGQYTIEMFARIDDGSFDFDNFATARAGKFSWLGVGGDEFPDKDLLVTGGVPNVTTVNNDSDDLAANNQWINAATTDTPAEFLRLDFVDLGISANQGGSDINTIPTATHYDANNVGFTIMQTQSGRPVDVRITAIDTEEGRGIGGNDIAADLTTGTPDEIIAVTVITNSQDPENNTKTYLKHDGIDDSGFVIWGENDVIVLNLEGANANQAHLRDQVFVSTEDGFNRLEIGNAEAVGSKDAFAIGDVEVGAVGQEIDLAFNGQIIDGDGDAASIGLVGVTLEPAPVV